MKVKVVLAIDLGTTGNRVIAFSQEGEILSKSYYDFPQIFPQSGWVEHNPFDILNTTLRALRDVVKIIGVNNVTSIGITNQRETTILWDKFTGKPVYNAIVWQCRRTENICRDLKQYNKVIKEKTGLVFKGILYGGFMLTKDGPKLLEYNVRFGDRDLRSNTRR